MKDLKRLVIAVPAVALVVLLVLLYVSRGTMEQLAFLRRGVRNRPSWWTSGLSRRRRRWPGLRISAEEQRYAQEAERLAEHEVEQAFATALRQATLHTTGGCRERLLKRQRRSTACRRRWSTTGRGWGRCRTRRRRPAWRRLRATIWTWRRRSLALDTDELADASADLARESGDQRGRIEAELAAFQTASHKGEGAKEPAVAAARKYASLWGAGERVAGPEA